MGTSGWINNVDTVIAVHNPGLFEQMDDPKIEFHILKQRFGRWPQVVSCDWDPEYGEIGDGKTVVIAASPDKDEASAWLDYDEQEKRNKKKGSKRGRA